MAEHRNLWAPWRMQYIRQLTSAEEPAAPRPMCFLCDAVQVGADPQKQAERLVLLNDLRGLILLNAYPYTNGHLLVACRTHVGDLPDLAPSQRADLIELTALAERTLRLAVNPQGINVGINLGRCAGAGLPGHLHVHVVPRWSGDTNFMQTIGNVRVIPQAMEESYRCLQEAMEKLSS